MNAQGAQWHGGIFILQYTSLKMALLLHKTTLVNFPMATTVITYLVFGKPLSLAAKSWTSRIFSFWIQMVAYLMGKICCF